MVLGRFDGDHCGGHFSPSSDPDTVAVEQVLTFWAAVAKAEGSTEITASNSAGEYGTVTLTAGATVDPAPSIEDDNTSLTDN